VLTALSSQPTTIAGDGDPIVVVEIATDVRAQRISARVANNDEAAN
jgi:hypothetical protein